MATMRHAVLFGLMLGSALPAAAQSGWATLVERPINADVDQQAMDVPSQNRAMQVMICIDGHAVQLQTLDLRFRGGSTQRLVIRARVPASGCSRIMDVHSGDRDIAGVTVVYQPASLQGASAQLQVLTR
jgi:hypothetical protein